MIGAGVLITQATSDSSFLDQSLETAAAYVGSQGVSDLMNQDPAFNAVFFRNLLMLPEAQFGHQQHALMAGYGSDMWERRRLRHGLFAGNGSPLNNTAAMVQIYSLMAGAQPHP
jgi:hypothetical protein